MLVLRNDTLNYTTFAFEMLPISRIAGEELSMILRALKLSEGLERLSRLLWRNMKLCSGRKWLNTAALFFGLVIAQCIVCQVGPEESTS